MHSQLRLRLLCQSLQVSDMYFLAQEARAPGLKSCKDTTAPFLTFSFVGPLVILLRCTGRGSHERCKRFSSVFASSPSLISPKTWHGSRKIGDFFFTFTRWESRADVARVSCQKVGQERLQLSLSDPERMSS